MKSPAVQFDAVSKRYVIRHQKTGYLKDRLTYALQRLNPFASSPVNETIEDFWALKDVSFRIHPGESVGIVGPNGSGKSTTLKILAGVTQQTSGYVGVHGKLGALIEVGAGFHPELSGRENVFLNGSILGMRKAEIQKKFDAIVAFAEVEQFIDTPVKHYSSGMYVRLGFSIAIHNEPEILLVDEVLAVGDLSFQRKCFDRMQELKNSGRTFVLISHSMPQIQSLCDRVILLKDGRLVADGSPAEVTELYTQQQGHAVASVRTERESSGESSIGITATRLLDRQGNPVTEVELGQPFVVEIEYDAREPLHNAIAWLHLTRGALRVFDSDTRNLGIALGTLRGVGKIRCEMPSLPLLPNTYDLQVGIFNEKVELQASAWHPRMLSIARPKNASAMGCGWIPESDQRGILYAHPAWSAARPTGSLAVPVDGSSAAEHTKLATKAAS